MPVKQVEGKVSWMSEMEMGVMLFFILGWSWFLWTERLEPEVNTEQLRCQATVGHHWRARAFFSSCMGLITLQHLEDCWL